MQGGDLFLTLLDFLISIVDSFPDRRRGKNRQFFMRDITLSAFSIFFCQRPSFLAHQPLMQNIHGTNHARRLFGVHNIPTDNHIRSLLDVVDPNLLQPAFANTFQFLQAKGVVESFRSFANTLLIPLEGTGYFHSESIHCPNCSGAYHRDGRVSYSHTALMPAVVKPGSAQVIPLAPEFVSPQDGHEKQDCENAAAKRSMG